MTQRDFLNYLLFVEHSAENLQFYLWFKDYERRFDALPQSEKALSPEWKAKKGETLKSVKLGEPLSNNDLCAQLGFSANALSPSAPIRPAPSHIVPDFGTPPSMNPFSDSAQEKPISHNTTTQLYPLPSPNASLVDTLEPQPSTESAIMKDLYAPSDLKWEPFTIQPFRTEIARVLAFYFTPNSPRELNLTYRERNQILHGLSNTTHPSALLPAVKAVEWNLRRQAHPNFVRWSLANGCSSRLWFAKGLGGVFLAAGFVSAAAMLATGVKRHLRIVAFLPWFLGAATLVAAFRGLCVYLQCLHRRQMHPWEIWKDGDDEVHSATLTEIDKESMYAKSYEDYGWKKKYVYRTVLGKILEKETDMEDTVLRRVQDLILAQSAVAGVLVGAILTLIFVFIG